MQRSFKASHKHITNKYQFPYKKYFCLSLECFFNFFSFHFSCLQEILALIVFMCEREFTDNNKNVKKILLKLNMKTLKAFTLKFLLCWVKNRLPGSWNCRKIPPAREFLMILESLLSFLCLWFLGTVFLTQSVLRFPGST